MATEPQSDSSDKYELEESGEPQLRRHSGIMERLKVCCNLLFDRRNIVNLPVITVKLFCIVLQCTAVLLLCIISLGATARYRRATKLLQRHVKETLPVLKETVLALARSQSFSVLEFTRSQLRLFPLRGLQSYDGKYDYDEQAFDPPSLDKRWRRFHSEKLICWFFGPLRTTHLQMALIFCLVSIYLVLFETSIGLVPCAFLFTCSFNCIYTSIAYTNKFWEMNHTYKGIEWAESLSPIPSVGVWWEVELIAMPAVWTIWMYIGLAYVLFFDPEEDQLPLRDYLLWILISLLFVFGILHGSYILLVAKWDNEAIEKSWSARTNGWVFEQQYVASAVSEGVMDSGLQVEVM